MTIEVYATSMSHLLHRKGVLKLFNDIFIYFYEMREMKFWNVITNIICTSFTICMYTYWLIYYQSKSLYIIDKRFAGNIIPVKRFDYDMQSCLLSIVSTYPMCNSLKTKNNETSNAMIKLRLFITIRYQLSEKTEIKSVNQSAGVTKWTINAFKLF